MNQNNAIKVKKFDNEIDDRHIEDCALKLS